MPAPELLKNLKVFGEYLKELIHPTYSNAISLLGLGSTIVTYVPGVGQNSYFPLVGWGLFIIGFVSANFRLYRKYAVPRFVTELVGELDRGAVSIDNRREVYASVRIKIRVVNNSDKSCSVVNIRVHSEGEWDWIIERLCVDGPPHDKHISLPYSIPAHDARQLELDAVLRTVAFVPDDIHFNKLKLEVRDQTNKTYSHWLTAERTSTNAKEIFGKIPYPDHNKR